MRCEKQEWVVFVLKEVVLLEAVAVRWQLSRKGDNAAVDMLVGDIYGSDYSRMGLKAES